jgi:hypothetical protein
LAFACFGWAIRLLPGGGSYSHLRVLLPEQAAGRVRRLHRSGCAQYVR